MRSIFHWNVLSSVKRVAPENKLNLFEQKEVEIKERMRIKSRKEFSMIETLSQKETILFLKEDLLELLFWKRIYLCIFFPIRIVFKIGRAFKKIFYKGR